MEQKKFDGGFRDLIRRQWKKLQEWLKPEPTDNGFLTVLKTIFKFIVVLLLVVLSPVILLILLFVFFAVL